MLSRSQNPFNLQRVSYSKQTPPTPHFIGCENRWKRRVMVVIPLGCRHYWGSNYKGNWLDFTGIRRGSFCRPLLLWVCVNIHLLLCSHVLALHPLKAFSISLRFKAQHKYLEEVIAAAYSLLFRPVLWQGNLPSWHFYVFLWGSV